MWQEQIFIRHLLISIRGLAKFLELDNLFSSNLIFANIIPAWHSPF